MPWVGVESSKVDVKKLREIVEGYGLVVLGEKSIEVKTSRGWLRFLILEVAGFVEGVARALASELSVTALEAGPHLVLGEVSAKLWDEAVKVVFPDGEEELIPVYRYDGFLDLKLPTDNVRGVEATIVIKGETFTLPLKFEDLLRIREMGKHFLEKVEKAAAVYGTTRIIAPEALRALRERAAKEVKVEVDYETGFVLIYDGARISTRPILSYVIELVKRGDVDKAKEILEKAPEKVKEELAEGLREEASIHRSLGDEEFAKKLEEVASAGAGGE